VLELVVPKTKERRN